MHSPIGFAMVAAGAFMLFASSMLCAGGLDDPPKTYPAPEARNHANETCTIEMTVRASKNASKRKTYFLNSEEDFRDAKNFAVVISYDDAKKFAKAGIDDPADFYRSKTIRVTGKVISEDEETRIRVEDPKQITLVEQKR